MKKKQLNYVLKKEKKVLKENINLQLLNSRKTLAYYKELEILTGSKRSDVLKKLANDKKASFSHYTTKMLLLNL